MKTYLRISSLLVLCLFYSLPVLADGSKETVLTLDLAKKIVAKADAFANGKKWLVSITVVNNEGNILYFQRNENAYVGSIESSMQKAKSANAFQRPTSAFVEAVKQGKVGIISGAGVVAIEGGVPILMNGKHIGAIGVSGAKAIEDEECANAGLAALK